MFYCSADGEGYVYHRYILGQNSPFQKVGVNGCSINWPDLEPQWCRLARSSQREEEEGGFSPWARVSGTASSPRSAAQLARLSSVKTTTPDLEATGPGTGELQREALRRLLCGPGSARSTCDRR